MLDFDVLKDLIEMVMDDDTEVVDVKAGRKMSKEEIREFLDELCADDEEEIEDEELSLEESTKQHVADVIEEMGKEYAEDTVSLSTALTKIAFAMDQNIPIRHEDVDMYNYLIKKLLPKNSYPEYVEKQYALVDKTLSAAKGKLGI